MNRYFQRKGNVDSVDEGVSNNVDVDEGASNNVEFDVTKLPTDPGLRIPILDYNANIRDEVRRAYMLKGPWHSFRGYDESEDSSNPGNFLVQLQFLAAHKEAINAVTLGNASHNCKLTSPDVQNDIVNACAIETINVIIKDVGDSLFSILVDEFCDVSMKEQMSIVLRYVDNSGHVNERFIGIEHVTSTTALSLKDAIDKVFSRYNLSMSRLRGQGYDGASNMLGKFNGLKTLILKESSCAFYIHCFAHQLQHALVAVAKKNILITNFFRVVGNVINTVGASSKRCDLLREKQLDFIVEALEKDVFAMIVEDESCSCSCNQRSDATNLLELIQRFDFAFNLQLMRSVFGMSNELSKALQRKDQDIVNAMQSVRLCKRRLQIMRDERWDFFFEEVCSFCQQHYIHVPNMDDMFVRLAIHGRPQRNSPKITNLHHYRVDLFYSVIDLQLQELNDRFSEVNTELLLCVACLCPQDSFSSFDKKSLIRLAELYPLDFSAVDGILLSDQLETYILDMRSNKEFEKLNDLGDLAEKLVLTKKDKVPKQNLIVLQAIHDVSKRDQFFMKPRFEFEIALAGLLN
ncbi:zinc finger MYM-type protein 1-like [Olea europaea var. sylvestris]|uniref:zinc finger MYM-type protein 1-like n=1 Tax=Olea europaea var. sylvestris TaxID=158386 RepID=UPI000C1D4948|nr:zinc finger MYM-type protein 1-like [Olea europaea var. sylvestris]